MNFESLQQLAGIGGMLLFIAFFIGVLIYTFRPGNKAKFDRAAHLPLERGED